MRSKRWLIIVEVMEEDIPEVIREAVATEIQDAGTVVIDQQEVHIAIRDIDGDLFVVIT